MDSNRHGDWPLECKVYIGDLGEDATRRELEEAFDKFGRVRNVWIAKRPPGFAFVLMDDPRDAEDATRELDGSRMCGRRVKVQMSKPVRNHGGDGGRDRGYDRPYPGDRGRGRSRSRTPERRRRRSPSYRSMSREKSRSRSRDRRRRSRS